MLPIIKRIQVPSTSPKTGRRQKECIRSKYVAMSMYLLILVMSSVVHGFTTATRSAPAIGEKVRFSSTTHVGQRRYQQDLASRTTSLVLTSSKSMDVDGSTVNGSPSLFSKKDKSSQDISKLSAFLSKIGLMAYIASMCLALPIALFPPYLLHRFNLISRVKQQNMALANGQFCARWLLRLIPFCKVTCHSTPEKEIDPQPSVWVCNHTSALDIFILLARDFEMRGNKKRPIKIIYVSTRILKEKSNRIISGTISNLVNKR